MTEDTGAVIALVSLILFMPVMYAFGMQNGKDKGRNETLVLCMEKPTDCKIKYDYLKLEEQKGL